MIKRLLNKIISISLLKSNSEEIEKYLANSKDLIDLEQKIRELEKKGAYSKLHI